MKRDAEGRSPNRLRVLFVPDSTYWITGRIARQIALYNPWIEPTICSYQALRKLLQESGGSFPGEIDLAHFLTPVIASEFVGGFREQMPCVTTIHHVEDERSTAAEPQADAIMTVCKQWHDHLISIGVKPEKLVMVPNGVHTELFRPPAEGEREKLRRKFGLPGDAFAVGFSAKRSSDSYNRKGTKTLAAAMVELKRQIPNVALVIVGPGWQEFVAKQTARGIRCVYVPFVVDQEELAPIYRMLDVYWVTARIEGGPVPLLEAMGSGVPCVTTPVGVALEIVRHGENGLRVNFDDAAAFVEQSSRLAADPAMRQRLGEAARQAVLRGYQCAETSKSARQLYQAAIAAFRRRQPDAIVRDVPEHPEQFKVADELGETLNGVPVALRSRLAAEEHLIFMRDLMQAGANQAAYKLGLRALRQRPMDWGTWRSTIAVSAVGPAYNQIRQGYRHSKSLIKRWLHLGP